MIRSARLHWLWQKDKLQWAGVLAMGLFKEIVSLIHEEKSCESFTKGPLVMTSLTFPSSYWVIGWCMKFYACFCLWQKHNTKKPVFLILVHRGINLLLSFSPPTQCISHLKTFLQPVHFIGLKCI